MLGLDIGTSSVRGLIHDSTLDPVDGLESHHPYSPDITADGGVTVDAERLIGLVCGVLDDLQAQCLKAGVTVEAVGTSCFWHSLLVLGPDNTVLTPVIQWADTRPAAVIPSLSSRVDSDELRRRTGARLHASYWPAKLWWLARTQPGFLDAATRLISFAEFLYDRLLDGPPSVGISMASGTGLLNVRSCEWDAYALSILPGGCASKLSTVDDQRIGRLDQENVKRWPFLAEARWFPALGDGACSNLGAAGTTPGRFVVTVGTSSAVRTIVKQPAGEAFPICDAAALWNYRVDAQYGVVGGALSEGGNLIAWLEANLRLAGLTEVETMVAAKPPASHGLTVLPFIAGQRSPEWAERATATITGIGLHTTPTDILQACLEAVALQIRRVYQALSAQAGVPSAVIGSGAALAMSSVWTQIIATVLEHPLVKTPFTESSSRGAAAFALDRLGALDLHRVRVRAVETFEPGEFALYEQAARRQQTLYDGLIPLEQA